MSDLHSWSGPIVDLPSKSPNLVNESEIFCLGQKHVRNSLKKATVLLSMSIDSAAHCPIQIPSDMQNTKVETEGKSTTVWIVFVSDDFPIFLRIKQLHAHLKIV